MSKTVALAFLASQRRQAHVSTSAVSGVSITITSATNGWVLTQPADALDMADTVTVIEEATTDVLGLALLWEIIDVLGLQGGRYDARRLYVGTKPGDKHHDLHPASCADCECGCVPDQSTAESVA